MLKKIAIYLALVSSILTIFAASFWLNLDTKTLTPWFEHQINKKLPKRFSVSIQSTETKLLGLTLNQIHLIEKQKQNSLVHIQSVDFTIGLLDLMLFQEIGYKAELYEGNVNGKIAIYPEIAIEYQISSIYPNLIKPVRKTNLIHSNPTINGSGIFSLQKPATGRLDLSISDLTISGKSEFTNLPFELPTTNVEIIKGSFSLHKNKLEISVKSSGQVKGSVNGNILFNNKTPKRSKMDLIVNGQLNKEYEANLGFLKDLLVSYKNKSGQLSVKISGSFQRPNFRKI